MPLAGLVRSRCEILAVGGSREPPQHWHRRRAPLPACGRADTRPAIHGETAAREGAAQGHAGAARDECASTAARPARRRLVLDGVVSNREGNRAGRVEKLMGIRFGGRKATRVGRRCSSVLGVKLAEAPMAAGQPSPVRPRTAAVQLDLPPCRPRVRRTGPAPPVRRCRGLSWTAARRSLGADLSDVPASMKWREMLSHGGEGRCSPCAEKSAAKVA